MTINGVEASESIILLPTLPTEVKAVSPLRSNVARPVLSINIVIGPVAGPEKDMTPSVSVTIKLGSLKSTAISFLM